jgi:DNA-binding transcriptional MerR regulator
MAKAKDAFRTISEVAEWLDTPTHVLRFWESKFSQIRPVKGAGGRRYYRPSDMDLLGGIKQLLHEEGMTIKGTQKLLRDKGVKHVATLGKSMSASAKAEPVVAPEPAPVAKEPTPEPVVEAPAPAAPAPEAAPFQDALPFDAPATKAPEPQPTFEITLPPLPDKLPDLPAKSFGLINWHSDKLRTHAAQIAPLVKRLEQLRDRMQNG